MRKYLTVFALLFSSCFWAGNLLAKKAGSDIETKIAIEKNLEERLRKILTEITGTDKFIIVINAQLVGTKTDNSGEDVVLPGVPLQEKLGLGIASLNLGDTAKNIKKLTVQIIVDKALPDSIINIIKEVSGNILGLQKDRGDTLTIKKMSFRKNAFHWSEIVYPPNLWGLLFSLVAVVFVAGALLFVTSIFPGSARTVSETISSSLKKTGAGELAPQAQASATALTGGPNAAAGAGAEEKAGHFSFIDGENMDKLLFLLKKEKPDNVATLINFVPQFADRILEGIDPALAKEALSRLTYTRALPAEEVTSWEEELKTKLDFMAGGEQTVADILENMDEKEMDSYISFLKEGDSKFAQAVERKLFRLSSLGGMPAEDIALIYRNFNPADFADVLRSMPEGDRDGVLSKLPGGIATRLKEEIELASPPGEEKIKRSRRALSHLAARLKKEGLLSG